ncbi:MAG: hypothetical protein V7727_03310 [Sneathiella sp.]
MKNILVITILLFLVAACSTVKYVNKQLVAVEGQHIDVLIDIIGFPNREQVIAGRKAYIWNSEDTVNSIAPVFSTTQGSAVINSNSLNNRTTGTYNQSTTAYVPTTRRNSCTITVEVDQVGTILSSRTHGTRRGCKRYVTDFKLAKVR